MTNERKEIIQISGTTILIVCVVIANLLSVGLVYRWYSFTLYQQQKAYQQAYGKLQNKITMVHREIVLLEGVTKWKETQYATYRNSIFVDER
jgi:membrane protein implicated in regulation of membrane protease activity